ncbi:hypothetical protein OB2597_00385 [Pseudooceanicola batsensis HTCC2597]|uniref:Glycosyl transferase family 2 n=1 Tax=Pseudooceanicola batsensis (strain ATCC BAA-863 / DSM 15984 / KCTC 12145 / HTCC2597) TaxID=252305 RepID=A3U1P7_PSEBH|nr:glycosyltransferase family 2 protein [Pseudooceanicola batsensis]EAQ01828.1 hypothetical protein OB2597_00385 [Pseudooceanicola batsensis HTCC2597]
MTTWGLVSTIRAPRRDVLDFAAWHLDLGAHRLFIHLDETDPGTFAILKAHPRIRPLTTDAAYWEATGKPRPEKHQARQTRNATRTYRRRADVDWLGHIDVDEFLIPDAPVETLLAALPADCHVARLRPMEALAPDAPGADHWNFKMLTLDRKARRQQAPVIWPTYGPYLDGGFLSHVAGKILVRTGLPGAEFRIHNILTELGENPGAVELSTLALAHLHATDWAQWRAHYRFRHERGSYRAGLKPNRPVDQGGLSMHDLLATIEAKGGEPALRHFFDEVCAATPGHLDRLARDGLLRRVKLPLDAVREKHFPGALASA